MSGSLTYQISGSLRARYVLKAAMRAYLRSHNQKKQQKMQTQKTGKVTVKQELKAENPMEWVRHCNNIRNRVDEIILNELIYV